MEISQSSSVLSNPKHVHLLQVQLSQLAYWKQQLDGATTVLSLPTDRPRPAMQTFHSASKSFALSVEITEALSALGQQEGATLFMTLLAAFNVLLYRYTGTVDLLVGSPVRSGAESHTLVLRTQVSGDSTFQHLLGQVREVCLGAYAHQVPFEILLEALPPEADLSRHPMFQVMFGFQDDDLSEVNPGFLNSKLDLTLFLKHSKQGLTGLWQYNPDLFDVSTIDRLNGHFQTLLAGIVADPHQLISQLPILSAVEEQLFWEWNDTQKDYHQDKCIHQLFEEQVERTPDAVAVVFAKQHLTFRELNRRANQLAHYLRTLGVGPDVLVGICIQRSLEMLVGLLGILKAGGAYVPLDPAYPQERLSFMIEDTQVPVLLTQETLLPLLPQITGHVVCLDSWGVKSNESTENVQSGVSGKNLAYVIYTSGSTGKPKGVLIEHHSVLNLSLGLEQAIYANLHSSQLRVSLNGSLSFDTSVKQWIQLLHGHTVDIVPEMVRYQGSALLSYLQDHQIDVFDCTPSQLELLVEVGLLMGDAPKCILVGGEALTLSTWQTLAAAPNINFYNVYGPTECTVDATLCHLRSDIKPSIGRAIANTKTYILDSHLQPVPIGVPGELYIGGVGLARGYFRRPDITDEKFIPNPFQEASRLYKTGDLVRYLSDGNIEYLGRIDNQVKIRGFRIELGEIESLLNQHPAVLQTIVIADEDRGNKRLIAYLVCHQETPQVSDLRDFLKDKLPEYMVPAVFVFLKSFPLTPNGKVDRRNLPSPEPRQIEATFVGARNELELQIVKIWEKVLGIEPIGVRDNFFELGGHSLLAMRMLAEIEKVFGKNLTLSIFVETQTVEQLVSLIGESNASSSSLVMIKAGGDQPPLFCVHAVWGNVLFYRQLAQHLGGERPFYALEARGVDGQVPRTSVVEMASEYIKEIQTVQPQGPYFLGGYSFGGLVAFEMARQLQDLGQEIALLAMLDTVAPSAYTSSSTDTSFWSQMFSHSRQLWQLTLPDKLAYLQQRLQYHFLVGKLSIFYRLYLRYVRRSLPDLRLLDVAAANNQARKSYTPQVYGGSLTIFRASQKSVGFDDDPKLGWGGVAAGETEIHQIPGSHTDLMTEPQVRLLAEKLQLCLDKTQMVKQVGTNK